MTQCFKPLCRFQCLSQGKEKLLDASAQRSGKSTVPAGDLCTEMGQTDERGQLGNSQGPGEQQQPSGIGSGGEVQINGFDDYVEDRIEIDWNTLVKESATSDLDS